MSNKNFFLICILSVGLYYISLWTGNFVRRKKAPKRKVTKDYIDNVIKAINRMDGGQFEDFVGFLFREMGYRVKQTPKTRDGGKDLVLNTQKGKVYVEVKRYASKNLISSTLVLKLIGSAVSDGVNRCLFLTTSGYTKDAVALAESSKIRIDLVDLDGIIDMLKKCNSNRVMKYLQIVKLGY